MQQEIREKRPLLDEKGNIEAPGFAKKLLWDYDRSRIKCGPTRIKEWDYYLVCNDHFAVALTVADNGYMGLDSISFLNFDQGWQVTKSPMDILPMGRKHLPNTSETGVTRDSGKGYSFEFRVENGIRRIKAHMDKFREGAAIDVDLILTEPPAESMVIATPFEKQGHFYYNQKINCLRASGRVSMGPVQWRFAPETSMGVLDWGRGVWTYHNTWYWGSASGHLEGGVPFGFNLGYGFGNTAAATENMLFYNGKAHKLGAVTFHIPQKDGKEDYLKPWTFTSDDGRFEMDFVPVLDRAACTSAVVIKSDQHQVFGRFTGKAVLDDGTAIPVKDFMGFAEKVENKW
ncbi:MAG: DUF2804 domain-containing protein [Oscillospiraceae bacterium]